MRSRGSLDPNPNPRQFTFLWNGWTLHVTLCSTVHEALSRKTVKCKVKKAEAWQMRDIQVPDAVVDCNQNSSVDLSDTLCGGHCNYQKVRQINGSLQTVVLKLTKLEEVSLFFFSHLLLLWPIYIIFARMAHCRLCQNISLQKPLEHL